MKVARLHAVGDLRLADEAVPEPGPGMSLVRVSAVGICGSDLHWWGEAGIGDATLSHPLVLGHEAAGVIEDGPRRGERVAIDPAIWCGTCRSCRAGYRNLCTRIRFAGHGSQDGAMREFMTWPSHLLHPLPDSLSDADGAVLEPLGVAIHALDLGHVRLGATVAVAGCGPIGLLLIQVLRAARAHVVAAFCPPPPRRGARCPPRWCPRPPPPRRRGRARPCAARAARVPHRATPRTMPTEPKKSVAWALATARRVNHLLSAGTIYHGA